MISIVSFLVLIVCLSFWWRESLHWVLLYLAGALIFIIAGMYEDLSLAGRLLEDQHFFANNALQLCSGEFNEISFDLRYSLYGYFISNSTFLCDYISVAFWGKLSFSFLWAGVIASISHYSYYKHSSFFWNRISLFSLVFIGWFFSSFLLRDGLAALSLLIVFLPFIINASFTTKIILPFLGCVALTLTRPQLFLMLVFALMVYFILRPLRRSVHNIRVLSVLFAVCLFGLFFFPLPEFLGDLLASYLVPHGTSATSNSSLTPQQVKDVLSGGGLDSAQYLFKQIITRFPSVFYEPNPLRSVLWIISLEELGNSSNMRIHSLLISAMCELIYWIFIAFILWSLLIKRNDFNSRLGGPYTVFIVLFIFTGLIYAIKYLGIPQRVSLGLVSVGFMIFSFRHPNDKETRQIVFPCFCFWFILQLMYLFIKPFDYIWVYL